jgi:hypothetical protein
MKLVIIESPYKGDVVENVDYAKQCMLDSLKRGECPFASHLLYTQILDDSNPDERSTGIALGMQITKRADLLAIYTDNGITKGMDLGLRFAKENNIKVEYRTINDTEYNGSN